MSSEQTQNLAEIGAEQEALFVQNMIHFRDKRGLTQGGLAALLRDRGLLGMYQTTLSRIEQRERALKFHEALAIARALDSSMEQMLGPTAAYEAIQGVLQAARHLQDLQDRMAGDMKDAAVLTDDAMRASLALQEIDWKANLSDDEIGRVEHSLHVVERLAGQGLQSFIAGVEDAYRFWG